MTIPTLFIYGATATGKTGLADHLADHLPVELINMDSSQFYRPLTIGTAKPPWQSSRYSQHMFDIADEPKIFTVHAYREAVLLLMDQIRSRGNIPLFVGGSGFYLMSLLFPVQDSSFALGASADPPAHKTSADRQADKGEARRSCKRRRVDDLWHELNDIDAERARTIHPNDLYRIQRALDIWYTTKQKPSVYKPIYKPLSPFMLIHVTRDRDDLYRSIDARTKGMVHAGWIDEAASLVGTSWESFVKQKKIIGYNELIDYVRQPHEFDIETVISNIQQKTRNYAKRQDTFGRMIKRLIRDAEQDKHLSCGKIVELNLTNTHFSLYIKQLLNSIMNRL